MKTKYILISIVSFFSIIPNAYARCGREDMKRITDIANNITVTAQYAKDENGHDNGNYNLIINGLTEEIHMVEETTGNAYYYYDPETQEKPEEIYQIEEMVKNINYYNSTANVQITMNNLNSNKYRFKIYYDTCDSELIRTIVYDLPKYNDYANDPLCEGINEEDLDVCSRKYQDEIDYETFKEKVNEYKEINNLLTEDDNEQQEEKNIFKQIVDFIKQYYFYIIALIVLIVITVSIITIKKKRGALE